MFAQIQEKIFYVYGALNFAWIPLVYLFWPEVGIPHTASDSPILISSIDSKAFPRID
jgi:hypothetical protein